MTKAALPAPDNVTAFRAGTMALAIEGHYPVLTPTGTFVHDARAAWLVGAVEAWHEGSQRPRIRKGWFSASALGKTDDELIADYNGEGGETHNARKLRIFDLGHDRDRSWKRYLKSAGLSSANDKDRKIRLNWLRLQGTCDDIVRDLDGNLCVVEFKTKAEYMFTKLDAPDPAHILQVHAYMGGLAISQSIVLYEGKNSQSVKAFYVPFDQAVWTGIVQRLQRLRGEAGL